jgi:hypothetical protein
VRTFFVFEEMKKVLKINQHRVSVTTQFDNGLCAVAAPRSRKEIEHVARQSKDACGYF